jgi:hypothetical protein
VPVAPVVSETLVIVLFAPLIVLFVSVSVPARVAYVSSCVFVNASNTSLVPLLNATAALALLLA